MRKLNIIAFSVCKVMRRSLLQDIEENPSEKRKAWIYEVPLSSVHHLRENLNTVAPGQAFPAELISKYDAPVIASTIKLWALELDPPLATWEGWDDFRRIYPSSMWSNCSYREIHLKRRFSGLWDNGNRCSTAHSGSSNGAAEASAYSFACT